MSTTTNGQGPVTGLGGSGPFDPPTRATAEPANSTAGELTWRRAGQIRRATIQKSGANWLGKYLRQERAKRRWITALLLALVMSLGYGIYYSVSTPNRDAEQSQQISELQTRIDELTKPVFPLDAAISVAHPAASSCLNYSDQADRKVIDALTARCGWNGTGVANMSELYYDPDPKLRAGASKGALTVIPFRGRLATGDTVLYYVPVRSVGQDQVEIAGNGAFFSTVPSLIAGDNTVDTQATGERNNPFREVLTQLVGGANRYTVPGVTISFSGNGLKAKSVDKVVIYDGSDTERIVSAEVQLEGPTAGAIFREQLAFRMVKGSDGNWLVQSFGPDVNPHNG